MKNIFISKKVFNLVLMSVLFALFTNGCSLHHRLRVPYKHKVHAHKVHIHKVASYQYRGGYKKSNPYAPIGGYNSKSVSSVSSHRLSSYPQRVQSSNYSSYRGQAPLKIATNVSEIDTRIKSRRVIGGDNSKSVSPVSSHRLSSYPQRVQSSNYSSYRAQAPLKIATNASEIDAQAKSTRPMYISSQPMRIPSDVRFMNLSTYRNVMLSIINRTRASAMGGYPGTDIPVYWNRFLTKAAEAHSRDMAVHKFISHLGSGDRTDYARKAPGQGSNFYERIIFYGYPAQAGNTAGEILTVTKDSIVGTRELMPHFQHAIENFLKSRKHSYVLKNPRLNRIGISAYRSGNAIYWVIELVEERDS